MTTKGRILVFLFAAVLLGVAGLFLINRSHYKNFTINFNNSHDVAIYDAHRTQGDGNKLLVTKVENSGQSKRLLKNHSYDIVYSGDDGYQNGEVRVNTSGRSSLTINPYFSQSKLEPLASAAANQVQQAYVSTYPNVTTYELNKNGRLYHWGDWYGTTLNYTGDDNLNDDTLRIVFHKEGGIWVIKTKPPDITLSKYLYKDVPVDVLKGVNGL
jgi:hypothetical protein